MVATALQSFKGHTHFVVSVALSGDGKHLVTGSFDNTACLWEAASGKKLQTFQGHSDKVTSVALSGDSKHLVTGCNTFWGILMGHLRNYAETATPAPAFH